MDFFDALRAVRRGEKVTRLEWSNSDEYIFLDTSNPVLIDGKVVVIVKIQKTDGLHGLLISDGDMFGTDWVII
jgi:hypothetical protein